MNAPLPAHALLRPEVRLEDALLAHGGTVLLSGTQALVRLPLMQRAADAARGLDRAGFVTHTAFVERSPGPYPFVLDADYPGSH